MIRAFFRDGLVYTIPAILSRGLSIILVPLYTRVLSLVDFGVLDMLMVFGSLVNLTVALEVSQGVARFYAAEEDGVKKIQYASTAFWFTLFCYTLFLVITSLLAPLLSQFIIGRNGLDPVFRLSMAYIWANGIFYLVQNQFRWELRSKQYAICSVLVTLTTASLAVTLAYFLGWGLSGLLWGMLGGALAGCFYGISSLRASFQLVFNKERLKEMLLFSAPLVPSGIAVFISHYIDRLMINHFLSLGDLGLYGIGFRLSSIVGLVMVGFQGALTPLIYTNYKSPDTPEQIAVIFRAFCFFALMLLFGLVGFADEILRLLTTPEYYSAAGVVVFLAPAILISNMYIFAPGIGIAKKTYLTLWINIGGALANTCFNYFLIPLFGIRGAGAATLLGYVFVFATYMAFSQKLYPVAHNWPALAKATAATLGCIFAASSLSFGILPNILLKGALALALGFVLMKAGLLTREELSKAARTLQSRFFREET